MKTFYKAIFAPVVITLALAACNNSKHTEETPAADSTANSTTGNYSSDESAMQTQKNALKDTWNKRMAELDKQIEELDAKIDREKAESKAGLKERREELKSQRNDLGQKLDHMGEVTDDKWDAFKSDVDDGFDKLSNKVKNFFNNDKENDNNKTETK